MTTITGQSRAHSWKVMPGVEGTGVLLWAATAAALPQNRPSNNHPAPEKESDLLMVRSTDCSCNPKSDLVVSMTDNSPASRPAL
jgi:hypothetical protein